MCLIMLKTTYCLRPLLQSTPRRMDIGRCQPALITGVTWRLYWIQAIVGRNWWIPPCAAYYHNHIGLITFQYICYLLHFLYNTWSAYNGRRKKEIIKSREYFRFHWLNSNFEFCALILFCWTCVWNCSGSTRRIIRDSWSLSLHSLWIYFAQS